MSDPSVPFQAQVVFKYDKADPEEIDLDEGTVCDVLDVNEAGWWLVRPAGSDIQGWAPSNFLQALPRPNLLAPPAPRLSIGDRGRRSGSMVSVASGPSDSLLMDKSDGSIICRKCTKTIAGNYAVAAGENYHLNCFTCPTCAKPLAGGLYIPKDGVAYCEDDYHRLFGSQCADCGEPIRGQFLLALGKTWHPAHFRCSACQEPFPSDEFRQGPDGNPYCERDYQERFGVRCTACTNIIDGSAFEASGDSYHVECFKYVIERH